MPVPRANFRLQPELVAWQNGGCGVAVTADMNVWRRSSFKCAPFVVALLGLLLILRLLRQRSRLPDGDGQQVADLVASVSDDVDKSLCAVGFRIAPFTLCKRPKNGPSLARNVTMISLESSSLKFERKFVETFPDARLVIYGFDEPLDAALVTNHAVTIDRPDATHRLLSSLPFLGTHFRLGRLKDMVSAALADRTNAVLKLGAYDDTPELKLTLLEYLIDQRLMESFQQLHIWIQVGQRDVQLIKTWLKLIARLQKSGFQQFGIQTFGDNVLNWIFSTSWIRTEFTSHQRPVHLNALVNPLDPNVDLEEQIHQILTLPTLSCGEIVTIDRPSYPLQQSDNALSFLTAPSWSVCLDDLKSPCLVYSARISDSDTSFEMEMVRRGCEVHIFDPTLLNATTNQVPKSADSKVHIHRWALGGVDAKVVSGIGDAVASDIWKFVKASDVMGELGHEGKTVDVLRLNLQGGEWDVLQNLVTNEKIQSYKQLLVATHLWHGEEAFSLIDRYMRLQKLLASDFQVAHSRPLIDAGGKEQRCCNVVGWQKP